MSASPRAFLAPFIALTAIACAACALAASTWSTFGQTWDEPEHLAAGLSLLDHGIYDYDIQHPPLARLALAIGPYLDGARSEGLPPPDGKPEGDAILYDEGHYNDYLMLARAGALPFLALLVIVTFVCARSVVTPGTALLAAALLAATPPILGHGGLATLDVPAAATCLVALDAMRRWLERGRTRDALWLGVALGLAIATKLSAIPFVGLGALALMGLRAWEARGTPPPVRLPTRFGGLALAGLIAAVILTLVYGGRFVYLTDEAHTYSQPLAYLFGYSGPVHDAAYAIAAKVKVPEAVPLMLGGIEALSYHNTVGHPSYLLGEVRNSGWWYFYIVALAVKTPLPLLGLGLAGLGILGREGLKERRAAPLAFPVLFVVLLGFCSLYSRINIGVRHVLVLYPLLAVGAAVTIARLWRWSRTRALPWQRTGVPVLLGALLLWQGVSLARTWPDFLAYFNETVREPRDVLIDSDLDWGQDLKRLGKRLNALHVPSVSLAYLGTAVLSHEHLPPYTLLAPDARATGWIAVSALARAHAPDRFRWLDAYVPRERVGTSIDLYYIAPGTTAP
jgi:4-amino-4-deoxy-L-arabinose transferase-like glycosyltransferase